MEYVTLINRTKDTLEGLWDGRHYAIVPGKNSFPRIQADKFKLQNPIMGTEDPHTGQMNYKVGIEEDNDDCTPIETVAPSIERWDRKKLGGKPVEIVPGNNGLYSTERHASLSPDQGFVDPKV